MQFKNLNLFNYDAYLNLLHEARTTDEAIRQVSAQVYSFFKECISFQRYNPQKNQKIAFLFIEARFVEFERLVKHVVAYILDLVSKIPCKFEMVALACLNNDSSFCAISNDIIKKASAEK